MTHLLRRAGRPLRVAALGLASAGCAEVRPEPFVARADEAMLASVREEIRFTWSSYVEHAWGRDELRPVSLTGADWGATPIGLTIVDGVDTLLVAGLDDEAEHGLAWIREDATFDLDQDVSVFETSIRALGGLLSTHTLTGDARSLDLARDLADRLLPAFDTPTGMPRPVVNLRTGVTSGAEANAAQIGTYLLEFATLSDLTGDARYEAAARRALEALHATRSPATGLVPSGVDVETGAVTLPLGQIGGGVDSYYEYLLKGSLLLGDDALRGLWDEDIAAVHAHAAERTDSGLWYGLATLDEGTVVAPVFGALSCFLPGTLALAGDLDRARELGESCWTQWETFGPSPDAFDYRSMTLLSPNHELRPEVVESFWYLYRATGDEVWRERGRTLFEDVRACCRVDGGYTTLRDVRTGEQGDGMPSFWLAETLKYFFLLFADGETLPHDAWVLTTEAHPLPRTR